MEYDVMYLDYFWYFKEVTLKGLQYEDFTYADQVDSYSMFFYGDPTCFALIGWF